jgi:hypothetical protein
MHHLRIGPRSVFSAQPLSLHRAAHLPNGPRGLNLPFTDQAVPLPS